MSSLREGLKQSAANRAAMIKKFGMVPHSVLRISRGDLSQRMFQLQAERRADRPKVTYKDPETGINRSTRGSGGHNRPHISIMPAELVEFFIKYYARPGDVYIDPFMGQGVQMQTAKLLGLHYYGYDLSTEFFAYIDKVRSKIDDGKTTLHITHGDSRYPDRIPDGIGDFSFHSPPYWDIEFYGDEPEQLGTGKTYEEFMDGMEQVARAWLPKFKSGAYHVVNLNDFRHDGKFYAYHCDTIMRFARAGWRLHDIWIIEGLVGGMPKAFGVDFNLKRIAPKVHEYALVFQKP